MSSLIGVAGAVAALGGAIAYADDLWHRFGWRSPEYVAGIEARLASEVREFRDEWKCDELDDELRQLLREQRAAPDDPDIAEDIRQIRAKRERLSCERFE